MSKQTISEYNISNTNNMPESIIPDTFDFDPSLRFLNEPPQEDPISQNEMVNMIMECFDAIDELAQKRVLGMMKTKVIMREARSEALIRGDDKRRR